MAFIFYKITVIAGNSFLSSTLTKVVLSWSFHQAYCANPIPGTQTHNKGLRRPKKAFIRTNNKGFAGEGGDEEDDISKKNK